ncbi:g10125 [Coccomyxa viridis]|uniref:G10125 protein n=1 Tax=Coccomyxa viridis TaxID=1274662 RepID=A0ABP1G7A1_9CHLO
MGLGKLEKRVGFIGAGQMAEALARGFISKGVVKASDMIATDPVKARRDVFESFSVKPVISNAEVVKEADIIFLAVKPQFVAPVLKEVRQHLTEKHTIVSIAAGKTLASLKEAAGEDTKLVRVMPNTPCLVGETASAMCLGGKASDEDAEEVRTLFSSVGRIVQVDEKLLSAVTGLSGSGPAYVFLMIEALADGGVRAGLPRDISMALAAQTVLGSAKMVLETGKHPGQLKDMVTSPGGTTIAGYHELEKSGVRSGIINAVLAATNRADEISRL